MAAVLQSQRESLAETRARASPRISPPAHLQCRDVGDNIGLPLSPLIFKLQLSAL